MKLPFNNIVAIALFLIAVASAAKGRCSIVTWDNNTSGEFADSRDTAIQQKKSHLNNIIKITPVRLTNLSNSSIEVGYERKTSRRFSTQFMAAWLLPRSLWDRELGLQPDNKGYQLAIEEKFYLKKTALSGLYFSFEIKYLNNKHDVISEFGLDTGYYSPGYLDTFRIEKQTISYNIKFGFQKIVKRFSFELFAGIGLKQKNVQHLDRLNPEDDMKLPRHPNLHYYTNMEGKCLAVSVPLNIRIGWVF